MTNARTFDFIAVMGAHRSGANRVAGVLNRLGLHFGDRFTGEYRYDAVGGLGFEEADLVNICNRVAPFPSTNYRQTHSRICVELQRWISQKRFEADRKVTLAAAKHPLLCRLGDHLISVCGDRLRVPKAINETGPPCGPVSHIAASHERGAGPEVYLKALSMARNIAHQEDEEIRHITTSIFDLVDLPANFRDGPPPKDHPLYYY